MLCALITWDPSADGRLTGGVCAFSKTGCSEVACPRLTARSFLPGLLKATLLWGHSLFPGDWPVRGSPLQFSPSSLPVGLTPALPRTRQSIL